MPRRPWPAGEHREPRRADRGGAGSLAFYGEQPSSQHVRRLLVTGGGSQLPALPAGARATRSASTSSAPIHSPMSGSVAPGSNREIFRTSLRTWPPRSASPSARLGRRIGESISHRSTRRASHLLEARRMLVGVGAVVVIGAAGALLHAGSQPDRQRAQTSWLPHRRSSPTCRPRSRARPAAAGQATSTGNRASPDGSRGQRRRDQHRLAGGRAGAGGGQRSARRRHLIVPGCARARGRRCRRSSCRPSATGQVDLHGHGTWADCRRRLARHRSPPTLGSPTPGQEASRWSANLTGRRRCSSR